MAAIFDSIIQYIFGTSQECFAEDLNSMEEICVALFQDVTTEPGYCIVNILRVPDEYAVKGQQIVLSEDIADRDTLSLASFEGENQNTNEFKKETDNTISEKKTDNMSVKMKSVGAIVCDGVRGTVFRVGSKYVMTALHVVLSITNPAKRQNIPDNDWTKLEDPNVWIMFAPSATDLQSPPFHIKRDVIFLNKELDIAILELKPGKKLPGKLNLSKDMGITEHVDLIGFGHPIDAGKCWDPNCRIVPVTCDLIQSLQWQHSQFVEKCSLRTILQLHGLNPNMLEMNKCYAELQNSDRFACHIVMEHGASGAPAIADNEVVGVLVKGVPLYYYALKNRIPTAQYVQHFPSHLRFELCTRADRMYEVIRCENPMLTADLFN
ncbi:uncharacterized protein LOC128559610 [Mercenaria mercenaria]|uniref:uncharacterized protein LOC128559610 n=1 Tax=Mercenaria mercenaria TaxID=6596 RepID=UPI00234EFD14|nr:uncharacterized protein LOC128559610 [Mercenaria mercenaria]